MLIYLGFVVIPESFPGRIDQLVELGIDFRFAAAALLPILLLAIYLIYRIVYGILFQFTSLKTLESE